jgi:hypothetical protein
LDSTMAHSTRQLSHTPAAWRAIEDGQSAVLAVAWDNDSKLLAVNRPGTGVADRHGKRRFKSTWLAAVTCGPATFTRSGRRLLVTGPGISVWIELGRTRSGCGLRLTFLFASQLKMSTDGRWLFTDKMVTDKAGKSSLHDLDVQPEPDLDPLRDTRRRTTWCSATIARCCLFQALIAFRSGISPRNRHLGGRWLATWESFRSSTWRQYRGVERGERRRRWPLGSLVNAIRWRIGDQRRLHSRTHTLTGRAPTRRGR